MRYPQLCNWILFRKEPDGQYSVKDCLKDEEYYFGSDLAYFARRLDGKTDPYTVMKGYSGKSVHQMLQTLDGLGMLRRGRLTKQGLGSFSYTVVMPRRHKTRSWLASVLDALLLSLWLPVLLLGMGLFIYRLPYLEGGSLWVGYFMGLILGIVLHEAAHAAAGLHYGARFFEAGVMMQSFMPGAYVLVDDSQVRDRLHRVQISVAGVEANLLLAGAALLLCTVVPSQDAACFGFALINLALAALNLTFSQGLDGASVMGELLGTAVAVPLAKYVLLNRRERQHLLQAGPHGVVELIACVILVLLQITVPALWLLGVLEVVECFF